MSEVHWTNVSIFTLATSADTEHMSQPLEGGGPNERTPKYGRINGTHDPIA